MQEQLTTSTTSIRISRTINEDLKIRAALLRTPLQHLTNTILQDWLDSQPVVRVLPKPLMSAGWKA